VSSTLTEAQHRAVAELIRISPVAEDLGRRFAAAGHSLHLVGGSVRDALLGRLGDDLDFTTDARPERVLELVAGWAEATWATGIAFGTVGVQRRGFRLEVTTYRAEVYDRSSRNPVVTYGESLDDDLRRRDFTVNAMAVALPDWRAPDGFVDRFGGLEDLAARVLRTPGTPQESFTDDPLRMLRAARFVAQLGFVPAPDVVAAMRELAPRLEIITPERVQAELTKLVLAPAARAGLELLVDTALADVVLPELPGMRLSIDPLHQHKDVYQHSLAVLDRAVRLEDRYTGGPDLVLRLAAVLHDIGKPRTRRFEPGGGVSFHHHEVVGRDMARKRLSALRYPRHVIEDVSRLVELHLRFHGYNTGVWTDSAVRRYVRDAGDLLPRLHALTRSDCTTRNRRRAAALAEAYDALEVRIAELAEQEALAAIRPDLDGHAVMRLLGVSPGPLVKRALDHLLELRMEHGPLGVERAERELLVWAVDQGFPPSARSPAAGSPSGD
jgi:poly(A) polymerase